MTIIEKLTQIQTNLIAPKGQFNSFGKYSYRSCEDILEGLKPHLKETKTAVTVTDEVVLIGERYYIKATATLHDCETAERVENTAYAREEETKKGMDASQVTGTASSYARKYALNGLFAIDDVKDADTRDNRQKEAKEQHEAEAEERKIAAELISDVKAKALEKRCNDEGVSVKKLCVLYKVKTLAELTESKFQNINQFWEKVKEETK